MKTVSEALKVIAFALALAISAQSTQAEEAQRPSFSEWLVELRAEARAKGISQRTLDLALASLAPIERTIELDRKQPEFTQTFWKYLNARVNETRIERGRELLGQNATLLRRVAQKYGVQPHYLVAFWGLESNYGDYTGDFPEIATLATLAYDERRGSYFRSELFDALHILDQGHIPHAQIKGSWAGAMGQLQFMPSTFRAYAVDGDGDGRIDIWNSLPDIFSSAANYLNSIGWDGDYRWGREVRVPPDFVWEMAALDERRALDVWRGLGVTLPDGGPLPGAEIEASLILPAGHMGPAFLVYDNFRSILTWNRSVLYAVAVGHLADRLLGAEPLSTPAHEERPLSRDEVKRMQELLNALGFDSGTPDGVVGRQTRAALRNFQLSKGLPADGYPTPDLLQVLQTSRSS